MALTILIECTSLRNYREHHHAGQQVSSEVSRKRQDLPLVEILQEYAVAVAIEPAASPMDEKHHQKTLQHLGQILLGEESRWWPFGYHVENVKRTMGHDLEVDDEVVARSLRMVLMVLDEMVKEAKRPVLQQSVAVNPRLGLSEQAVCDVL
ncbi:hypothetical protein DOTSEDRAFT_26169 [Dothistroma septosporum NZE10]|uniref:Uncharacterized protein n=1 Tax=Dothistroma septosporum (strain NZE10 / CBS 128990) TaxID=675120 RepID=N1PJL0_DOTSN|nr:hypothetical protein DOTSEDRAFT_26169 [Dothistroma septosporum NZE10]